MISEQLQHSLERVLQELTKREEGYARRAIFDTLEQLKFVVDKKIFYCGVTDDGAVIVQWRQENKDVAMISMGDGHIFLSEGKGSSRTAKEYEISQETGDILSSMLESFDA